MSPSNRALSLANAILAHPSRAPKLEFQVKLDFSIATLPHSEPGSKQGEGQVHLIADRGPGTDPTASPLQLVLDHVKGTLDAAGFPAKTEADFPALLNVVKKTHKKGDKHTIPGANGDTYHTDAEIEAVTKSFMKGFWQLRITDEFSLPQSYIDLSDLPEHLPESGT